MREDEEIEDTENVVKYLIQTLNAQNVCLNRCVDLIEEHRKCIEILMKEYEGSNTVKKSE